MFYYLLIVNKNGSLIYDRAFSPSLKLTSNEVSFQIKYSYYKY